MTSTDGTSTDRTGAGDQDPRPTPLDTAPRLAAIRDDALALAQTLADEMVAVSEARESSNVDDEHDPEGSTIAFERSQLEAIRRSALDRSVDAEAALERLGNGTYGLCVRCGRPIAPARLAARPMASLCIDCAGRTPR